MGIPRSSVMPLCEGVGRSPLQGNSVDGPGGVEFGIDGRIITIVGPSLFFDGSAVGKGAGSVFLQNPFVIFNWIGYQGFKGFFVHFSSMMDNQKLQEVIGLDLLEFPGLGGLGSQEGSGSQEQE